MTTDQTQRPRFFEGQYLGSRDLTDTLGYARVQAARHALGAHTWGIAEGLTLREVPAIGDASKVSVVIDPGYAWDGFGRPITVLEPYKIPEALFDSIKYDSALDASGTGRLTEIWLRYYETGTLKPAPGFEVCDTANTFRRIQESFVVDIGCKLAHSEDHDPITVGAKSGDALNALKFFNTKAPRIYDESIPQQTFPEEGEKAYWFIPIGYVRWLPAQSGAGHLVAVSDEDKGKSRRFRRYIGVVTENIESADGSIRLRDRTASPLRSKYKTTDEELVDVEGDTRVEGDVNIAGGALNIRHTDGTDRGTALRIQRTGDNKLTAGERNLEVGIGPSDQSDNRLEIGPMEIDTSKTPPTYTLDPKVTVVSDGTVGIGTTDPGAKVEINDGDLLLKAAADDAGDVLFKDSKDALKGHIWTDTTADKAGLYLASAGTNPALAVDKDGNVGVNTSSPGAQLEVYAGDLVMKASGDDPGDLIFWDSKNLQKARVWSNPAANTPGLCLSSGDNTPDIVIDKDGKVGVGTEAPETELHVVGDRIRLVSGDGTRQIDLRADGAAVDVQSTTSKLYLRSRGTAPNNQIVMNPSSAEGGVGVGTTAPQCKLHVVNSLDADPKDAVAHVALVENTSTGWNASVLALKVGTVIADVSNNFITFFSGNDAVGSIEGLAPTPWYPYTSINFNSQGADYAESLPHLEEKEKLEPGDVVGILGGRVTRRTVEAHWVSVITDRPVVVANSPRANEPGKFEKISFIGQVHVKVRGPVHAGEYILPSGADDGTGIAIPAEKITPQQAGQILGQAWETSDKEETRRVLVAVGLPSSHSAPLAALVGNLGRQIEELKEEVKRLKKA